MNDQLCIQIAEKVWGMDLTFYDYDQTAPFLADCIEFKEDGLSMVWNKNKLNREMNSWSGFGRTVEGMAKLVPHKTFWNWLFLSALTLKRVHKDFDGISVEEAFEAIYLAALEALKDV